MRWQLGLPRSSGNLRPINRQEFGRAEILGLATLDVIPSGLGQARISEFNTAYVAAIIRAAAGQVTSE